MCVLQKRKQQLVISIQASVSSICLITAGLVYFSPKYELPCKSKIIYHQTETWENTDTLQLQVLRKRELFNYCKISSRKQSFTTNYLIYSDHKSLLYCYAPYVGKNEPIKAFNEDGNLTSFKNASEVNINEINLGFKALSSIVSKEDRSVREKAYFTFLITQHPFERLVMIYKNEFEDQHAPHFQKKLGSYILRKYRNGLSNKEYDTGVGVTFLEFVRFVLNSKFIEENWKKITDICLPCNYKYNFIAKTETLNNDLKTISDSTGLVNLLFSNKTNQIDTKSLVERYFKTLPKTKIYKLYLLYLDDFLAFGYPTPHYN